MANIAAGQYALQRQARHQAAHPFLVQDTDLYSTIGYHQLWDGHVPPELWNWARDLQSELYFVLPDDVPFEPNEQRYGGNQRETDTHHWTSLLDAVGAQWEIVPSGTPAEQAQHIIARMAAHQDAKWQPVREFQRD